MYSRLALVSILLLPGCDEPPPAPSFHPGRRLVEGCPAGAVCSDQTPDGLQVRSLATNRLPPYLTAVGGVQRFQVLWHSGEPFDLDLVAAAAGPELSVIDQAANVITIRAEAAGGGLIELRDPATDQLYDQVWLVAKPIDAIFAPPLYSDGLFAMGSPCFAPAELTIEVELHSPDSDRGLFGVREYLVDESLVVAADAELAELAAVAADADDWTRFRLLTHAAGEGSIAVTAGGARHDIPVLAVDAIDGIGPEPGEIALEPGVVRPFCAFGLFEGWPVIGVDFDFATSGPLELRPATNGYCTGLLLTDVGEASLTASFGGDAQTWSVVARQ